jgi:hypothetical protein
MGQSDASVEVLMQVSIPIKVVLNFFMTLNVSLRRTIACYTPDGSHDKQLMQDSRFTQ